MKNLKLNLCLAADKDDSSKGVLYAIELSNPATAAALIPHVNDEVRVTEGTFKIARVVRDYDKNEINAYTQQYMDTINALRAIRQRERELATA